MKFLAQVCQTNRAGKDSFVPGRFAMTCCVQYIQFVGFPCKYTEYKLSLIHISCQGHCGRRRHLVRVRHGAR